jgi:hypothetical protein
MRTFLRFLFLTPKGMMILGGLTALLGASAIVTGYSGLPDRTALHQASGTLEHVVRNTRRRSSRVSHEIEIKSADGALVTLTLPEGKINVLQEGRLLSLIGRPVVALFSGTAEVWELASGSVKIIDYEHTRRRQAETQAMQATLGPYMTGGGMVLLLFAGVLWLRRRRLVATSSPKSVTAGASGG